MNKMRKVLNTVSSKVKCLYHKLAFVYCLNKIAILEAKGDYGNSYSWRRKYKDHFVEYKRYEKK